MIAGYSKFSINIVSYKIENIYSVYGNRHSVKLWYEIKYLIADYSKCSNDAFIEFSVQGAISVHPPLRLLFAERSVSWIIRGRHCVNCRRVPSVIHGRAPVTRMRKWTLVLPVSPEDPWKNNFYRIKCPSLRYERLQLLPDILKNLCSLRKSPVFDGTNRNV